MSEEELRQEMLAAMYAWSVEAADTVAEIKKIAEEKVAAFIAAVEARTKTTLQQAAVRTMAIDITAGAVEQPTAEDTFYWHLAYVIPVAAFAKKEASTEPKTEVCKAEIIKAGASEIDWNKPLEMTCPRPERWCPATRLYVRDKATQGFQRQYCNFVAPGEGGSDLEDSRSLWVNNKGRQFGGGNFLYVRNKKAQ